MQNLRTMEIFRNSVEIENFINFICLSKGSLNEKTYQLRRFLKFSKKDLFINNFNY